MAKSDDSTVSNPVEDALNAAQVVFSANPALRPQSKPFWQAQDRFLQEAEKFTAAWFKRRHDATRSALDAALQIGGKGVQDSSIAMKVMADWQAHSMERLTEDAKDCAEMMARCVGTFVIHEIEAAEGIVESTTKTATARHATPV